MSEAVRPQGKFNSSQHQSLCYKSEKNRVNTQGCVIVENNSLKCISIEQDV